MRMYNLNTYLLLLSFLTGFIGWCLGFLANSLALTPHTPFNLSQVNIYLSLGSYYSYLAMTYLLSTLLVSVIIEILIRIRFDSLLNYFKSIYHTIKFRNFLIQRDKSEKAITSDAKTITNYNPINDSFNRCARKSVVDIRKDDIKVFVKVPRGQQGQKVLEDMISQLKEEISSQHHNYFFSAPERIRNSLWLIGKRR